MKIISWNCNGAFRKKNHLVEQLDPDIMVIQECENPGKFITDTGRYGYRWGGSNPNKGLGVFFKKSTTYRSWSGTINGEGEVFNGSCQY